MPRQHACCVPKTFDESISIAVPFLEQGAETGQRCLFVADDNGPTVVRMALRSRSPRLRALEEAGRLSILDSKETPLAGPFDAQRLYAAWRAMTEGAVRDGFSGLRVAVEMTWALQLDFRALAAYERDAAPLFSEVPLDALCIYNRQAFGREALDAAFPGHGQHLLEDGEQAASMDDFRKRLGFALGG
jgi:hypothetical protein